MSFTLNSSPDIYLAISYWGYSVAMTSYFTLETQEISVNIRIGSVKSISNFFIIQILLFFLANDLHKYILALTLFIANDLQQRVFF